MRKFMQSTLVIALLASSAIATAQHPTASRNEASQNAEHAGRRITRTTTITRNPRAVDGKRTFDNTPRVDAMTRGTARSASVTYIPNAHARVQYQEIIERPASAAAPSNFAMEPAPASQSPTFVTPQIMNSVDMSVMNGGYVDQHRWTPRTNALFQQASGPDEWRDVCSCTRVDESRFDCRTKRNSCSSCGQDGCNDSLGCNGGGCAGSGGLSGKLRTLREELRNERAERGATRNAQRELRQASRPQPRERAIGCNKRGCSNCGDCTQIDATSECNAATNNQPVVAQPLPECGCNANASTNSGQ